ncbi:sulfotransferase [Xylanibacillus composti]|uniref:Sulfotransferase n=1 Tax=Xylanibacillus composti TaxID=1572762 RepID=A0A8J4M3R3_9BACL|nr:sulfotransferase [Xylanibacillus composti]MDT9724523.1 sulfotransferase [Xylanibacillus composti]GIQ69786.1 hypothetical protein XYCOK13_26100 [Xylanibacillus composti]
MISPKGHNLVFLLCTPRSGSSLTTVMLQNHSQIFASQEMWFLMSLFDLQHPSYRPYGGTTIIQQFFNGVLTEEAFDEACRAFALSVYNGLLQSCNARVVVDKSPRYFYCLEFLDRLFPESRRIWLIRNPLDVVASYKKVNRHVHDRFDLKQDLRADSFHIKMADITIGLLRYMSYFAEEHPNAYRLHYEQLVRSPRDELSRLFDFLGLQYEEGIEKYGAFMETDKSGMFYSMGVGDPFLTRHGEPHLNAVGTWQTTLDKEEVALYVQAVGARVFRRLGYAEALEEAERWTGMRFPDEPDLSLMTRRTRQLEEATGCKWLPDYRMKAATPGAPLAQSHAPALHSSEAAVLQLQSTLRSLERRLEKSYMEQERFRKKYEEIRFKLERIKALVPFRRTLSRLASSYLTGGRRP